MKQEHRDKAQTIFDAYRDKNTVHITSDNQAFFDSHHADAQAQNLKDRTVVSISRQDLEEEPEQADEAAAEEAKKKADEAAAEEAQKKADEAAAEEAKKKADEAAAEEAQKKADEAAAEEAKKKALENEK